MASIEEVREAIQDAKKPAREAIVALQTAAEKVGKLQDQLADIWRKRSPSDAKDDSVAMTVRHSGE